MQIRTILAVASLFAGVIHATTSFNVGGGLNLSNTNSKEETGLTYSNNVGFNVGGGLEFSITDQIGIASGLSLESRGFTGKQDYGSGNSLEGKANFLYLQIPVLGRINFPVGSAFLSVFAGPELGINVSDKMTLTAKSASMTADTTVSVELNNIDFGVSMGMGVRYPVGSFGIFFEPSYYLGLTNADKDSEDNPNTTEDESKNDSALRSIKFRVGIYKDL